MKSKVKSQKSKVRGFTLIETMVAVAIFTIVMVIGIGVLLHSNASYRQTETLRKVIDNLNFTMEDMARSMRVGSTYVCGGIIELPDLTFPSVYSFPDVGYGGASSSCPDGGYSIIFESATGDPEDPDDQNGFLFLVNADASEAKLYKTTDSGLHWFIITPPAVVLDPYKSGFIVTGADADDGLQPMVNIRLSGMVRYENIETPLDIETSVSSRLLDS